MAANFGFLSLSERNNLVALREVELGGPGFDSFPFHGVLGCDGVELTLHDLCVCGITEISVADSNADVDVLGLSKVPQGGSGIDGAGSQDDGRGCSELHGGEGREDMGGRSGRSMC